MTIRLWSSVHRYGRAPALALPSPGMQSVRASLKYTCDRARLGPRLAPCFAALSADAELDAWLLGPGAAPHGWLTTHLTQLLSGVASVYQVHGWLGSYPMHLLSRAQWHDLLGAGPFEHLLDVGAGAGYVTEGARDLFRQISCTETSPAMQRRLRRRGFEVHTGALEALPALAFDVVSCFNVLDRTARPHSLLRAAVARLAPGGRLLVAVPLPLSPHVHVAGGTVSPDERLPVSAQQWEGAARDLTEQVLQPAGLCVERLSRVPYLSRGDSDCPLYVLDAGVWVCRATSETRG